MQEVKRISTGILLGRSDYEIDLCDFMFNRYRTLASIPSDLHGVVIKESAQLTGYCLTQDLLYQLS